MTIRVPAKVRGHTVDIGIAMSEIQCILERLSNDSDAEYDISKALECLLQVRPSVL